MENNKVRNIKRLGNFELPGFFNYPPYFTLQPSRATREVQVRLWKKLILEYCRSQRIYIVSLEQDFPLFSNPAIQRSLSREAKEAFLSALVTEGHAEWMDSNCNKCLILWLTIQDWANYILNFVKENGLGSTMPVEDIRSGFDTRGTGHAKIKVLFRGGSGALNLLGIFYHLGVVRHFSHIQPFSGPELRGKELAGIDSIVLMRALRLLEQKGMAAIFKVNDFEGVKFCL